MTKRMDLYIGRMTQFIELLVLYHHPSHVPTVICRMADKWVTNWKQCVRGYSQIIGIIMASAGGDEKKQKSAVMAPSVLWLWSELGHTHSQVSSIPSAAD